MKTYRISLVRLLSMLIFDKDAVNKVSTREVKLVYLEAIYNLA